jgi:tRNA A58 N-methylase Trm61
MPPAPWLGSWLRYMLRTRLAPYVPVPPKVGRALFDLAQLRPGESVVDLGCGDGRLLQMAIESGAGRATGFELDEDLVQEARRTAAGDARIEVRHEDASLAGKILCEADVVTLYLTTRGNEAVLPLLRASLRPRARVVSYVWGMPELPPTRSATAVGAGVVVTTPHPNVLCWEASDLQPG